MTDFICEVDDVYRSACEGLDFYGEYEGKRYCVLHFPDEGKQADKQFQEALQRKLDERDFNLGGVYLPGPYNFESVEFGMANFSGATFGDVSFGKATFDEADFSNATFRAHTYFSGATFKEANFMEATFKEDAVFDNATFENQANFLGATFKEVNFTEATFKVEAVFNWSTFEKADFLLATFKGTAYFTSPTIKREVSFSNATFEAEAKFADLKASSIQTVVSFEDARIEKPELFMFYAARLHPNWFINVDARKFNFTNVEWYGLSAGLEGGLEDEIKVLRMRGFGGSSPEGLQFLGSPYNLLAKACRELSINAEESREYPLSNKFHYWSMEALRKEGWTRLGVVGTLYWALSGYGVRAARAFGVLLGMCVAFAALYIVFGPSELQDLGQAVVYSLGAVARLNPEPSPSEPGLFQFLVIVEGILGPLQIGLLALAIRRKVMR